jgi:transcriptional regulator with XRE-family HTH domain
MMAIVSNNERDYRSWIGQRIRALRVASGLSLKDVSARMREAGFPSWSADIVTETQTGRRRILQLTEAIALSRIFEIPLEELVVPEDGWPVNGTRSVADAAEAELPTAHLEALKPKLDRRDPSDKEQFSFWFGPGQREALGNLMPLLGVNTLARAARRTLQVGIDALTEYYANQPTENDS